VTILVEPIEIIASARRFRHHQGQRAERARYQERCEAMDCIKGIRGVLRFFPA
jgi:hypothetical protein